MFRHWWFLRLLKDREPDGRTSNDWRANNSRSDGSLSKNHLSKDSLSKKEKQQLVLHEWEALRDRLHRFAAERVALVGDVMRAAEPQFPPGLASGAAGADYLWAAEAYQAAGKLLDEAADLPDLAAAVVLADRAVERLVAAHERLAGRRPKAPATRCFYNPLHGAAALPSAKPATKKKGKGAQRLSPRQAAAARRPACEDCRLAILAGQTPDVLPALLPVQGGWHRTERVMVPYYAIPQQWSAWSVTACGAYDDEAPALVLRGGHRRPH